MDLHVLVQDAQELLLPLEEQEEEEMRALLRPQKAELAEETPLAGKSENVGPVSGRSLTCCGSLRRLLFSLVPNFTVRCGAWTRPKVGFRTIFKPWTCFLSKGLQWGPTRNCTQVELLGLPGIPGDFRRPLGGWGAVRSPDHPPVHPSFSHPPSIQASAHLPSRYPPSVHPCFPPLPTQHPVLPSIHPPARAPTHPSSHPTTRHPSSHPSLPPPTHT